MTQTIISGIGDDGSLFPIEKLRAHTDAVYHLAVSIFVFDGNDLLIQKRAASKYHCGGLWANTCCSHPNWNESIRDCADRRLREELGFTLPLEERRVVNYSADVGAGLHEHERVTLFLGRASRQSIEISANPNEVSDTRWVSPENLRREIASSPEQFTPWFKIYVERYPDLTF